MYYRRWRSIKLLIQVAGNFLLLLGPYCWGLWSCKLPPPRLTLLPWSLHNLPSLLGVHSALGWLSKEWSFIPSKLDQFYHLSLVHFSFHTPGAVKPMTKFYDNPAVASTSTTWRAIVLLQSPSHPQSLFHCFCLQLSKNRMLLTFVLLYWCST